MLHKTEYAQTDDAHINNVGSIQKRGCANRIHNKFLKTKNANG